MAIKDREFDLARLALPQWLDQALKFLAVGVLNTLLDAGLYLALTRWLDLTPWPALAKGISYGAGILNSFAWKIYRPMRSRKKRSQHYVTLLPNQTR